MAEENESPQEMSTGKFLFSREGRPVLIGTVIALIVFSIIGVYTWGLLFPEESRRPEVSEERRQQQLQSAGNTRIEAEGTDLRPDLTSRELTPEAREAVNQYNANAEREGRIPVPTPDDVEMVAVDPQPEEADLQENPQRDQGNQQASSQDRRLSDRERRELQRLREEEQAVRVSILNEYRTRKFEAANALVSMYDQPPQSASVSFDDPNEGDNGKSSSNAPMRIARNSDGTAGVVQGATSGRSGSGGTCEYPLVKGGEIVYAKTDIALNTDYEGPVRMTFLGGELNNYIGMGTFELNELGAKMKLKLDRIIDPDGQMYDASAWVLDPQTTLWAMASDVDRHIIYRYGGFGLGVVLSSFATLADYRATESEIVTPDGTRTTNNRDPDGKQVTWTVLGEFGTLFEEVFRDAINRPITVTLDPEEEAGVLFENTICEADTQITRERREQERREAQGLADPLAYGG